MGQVTATASDGCNFGLFFTSSIAVFLYDIIDSLALSDAEA